MNSTGATPKKINLSNFGLNLRQTAEDSEMFTNIWLSSKGLNNYNFTMISQAFTIFILYQLMFYHNFPDFYYNRHDSDLRRFFAG